MVYGSAGANAIEQELSRLRELGTDKKIAIDSESALMLAIGEDNTILWANDNAHEYFGKKPSGLKCYSICHGKHSCCKNCISKAVINDGITRRHKKSIMSGSGDHSCFLISISRMAFNCYSKMKSAIAVLLEVPHEIPVFNSKALIVDDNRINLKLIQKTLNSLGCEVTAAESGNEALEKFKADSFDVVFMDIQMPVMDGYQTACELRKIKECRGESIPVIALSAYQQENCAKKLQESGITDFIGKPFRKDDIIQSLRKHVKPWGGPED